MNLYCSPEIFHQALILIEVGDQKLAYDTIMDVINNGDGGVFSLLYLVALEKLYLMCVNVLLDGFRIQNGITMAAASSGIGSTLLDGG
ncbi:hypothetical protein ANCCEY_08459 [Ancylostoma ceylanicum]|uniref:Uncharacterized protein n=1 Tax=Ancylostoma ceylanicum TaxID=53326 RepID=A0A0D6LR08_9BILA|nr:hypothetical protein ANCCEY_08459 [Ancylostoma ceylanicum]